jgi:VanZ family protein
MKRFLQWGLVIACMAVIFISSAQPYQKQDMRPAINQWISEDFVIKYFSQLVIPYGGKQVSIENNGVAGFVEFLIRKGAHVFIYTILGFLVASAFAPIRSLRRVHGFAVIVFCMVYAISDEIHQHFTGDRTPLAHDVVLDTIGACMGLALYRLRKIVSKP